MSALSLTATPTSAATALQLDPGQFEHLARIIRDHFGIHLTDEKRMMLSMRMLKMMRTDGYTDFNAYFEDRLRHPAQETLSELVNHVSTNHTHFWREPEHFEFYQKVALPEILDRRRRRGGQPDLRVWCAASSTGEEPYTLAMLQREALGPAASRWKGGLLATDISTRALQTAREGIYPKDSVAMLPAHLRQRYLKPLDGDRVVMIDALKADVLYRRLNLVSSTIPLRGDLDAIFCRNVMIYFEESTKKTLVEQLYRLLTPGGYLFIGHAETLNNLNTRFAFIKPGLYRRG
ncbi:MAG: protein-glutamate O-methyltransferase CheR [Myxococcota bacterium]